MAHYDKHKIVACGHLCKHYERGKDESSNYVKFGNIDIDPERSHLNYNLAPEREQGHFGYIKHRIGEVKCQKRADVNVMCSWVVTAPKVLEENEHIKFFESTYKFLENRYGEKNVVSAYVHMDETTPHIHFAFVPVAIDKKKKIEKVSAKERIDRLELSKFHNDLSGYMEKIFGRDIGILNEATKEGNRSVEELKKGTATKKLEEIEQRTKKAEKDLEEINERIKNLEKKETDLKDKITESESKIKNLAEEYTVKKNKIDEIKNYKIKNGHGLNAGNVIVELVTLNQVEELRKLAMSSIAHEKKIEKPLPKTSQGSSSGAKPKEPPIKKEKETPPEKNSLLNSLEYYQKKIDEEKRQNQNQQTKNKKSRDER